MIKENFLIIKNYMMLIKKKISLIVGLFFFSILGHLFDLLLPVAASQIVEMVSIANYNQAFFWSILLGIFYLLCNTSWYFNYRFYVSNYVYIHSDLQSRLLNKVSTLDSNFYNKISKGKILNTNSTDLENLSDLIDVVCEFFIVSIKLIIISVIFLKSSIFIGLFVLLLTIFYINVLDINNKLGSIQLEGQKKYADKITDTLSETIEGLEEVQVCDLMPKLNKKFDLYEKKWRRHFKEKYKYVTRQHAVLPNIVNLGTVILYILLIILMIRGRIGVDTLILLISYFELLIDESTDFMNYSQTLRDNSISIKRFMSIFNYKKKEDISFGLYDNDHIFGLVEFQNVSYSYKEKEVFHHINMRANPNEITAILGETGSGKSTLLKLLLRQNKINSGHIFIDGMDIYDYNADIYPSNVTCISQNAYIFNMSIEENLGLVNSNRKNQIEVCKRVGLHDFILTLSNVYKTKLNENKNEINAEQKLLIAIARSLLTNAEIIIFDEIMDNLEEKILKKLISLVKDLKIDHTILLITHEKKIAKIADQIYLLENGKITKQKRKND